MDSDELLNVDEVASWLRVKPSWVYRHVDALGGYRLGKYVRFNKKRVLERLEEGQCNMSIVRPPTQRPLPSETKEGT